MGVHDFQPPAAPVDATGYERAADLDWREVEFLTNDLERQWRNFGFLPEGKRLIFDAQCDRLAGA